MLGLWIFASVVTAVFGDSCLGSTSGSHHAIGCVANQGCCQYGLVIATRCDGSNVCCYTSDICGTSHASGGSCLSTSEMTALESKLIEYEGIRYKAYDAQPTNSFVDWTICVGFNLKRSEARSVFSTVLPGVSFDSVYGGHTSLSRQQCMALFGHDLTKTYIPRAQHVAGSKFCGFPVNVKIALVSAVYRGDLAYSHKTAGYIRAGNWCSVPAEYLNYYQYTHCHQLGIPGVCTRMKWNADQFQTMCHSG